MACIPVCGQHEAGLSIGFINSSNTDRIAEGKANSHLIVAAPDLLEALEKMIIAAENIGGEHVTDHQGLIDQTENAYKVIAKARGEA